MAHHESVYISEVIQNDVVQSEWNEEDILEMDKKMPLQDDIIKEEESESDFLDKNEESSANAC
jgi:hypothetical protein